MGNCNMKLKSLYEYLDKQLDCKKRGLSYFDSKIEQHINQCPICQKEIETQKELFKNISKLEQIELPEDFTALLIKRVPQGSRQQLPNWSLMVGALVMIVSVAIFYIFVNWFIKFADKFSFIRDIFSTYAKRLWFFIQYFISTITEITDILLSLARTFWAIVVDYPVPFITMFLVAGLLFTILVLLINSFQRENYA